jgi:hypothetical protein
MAGSKINGAANAILLESGYHSMFEDFTWHFEAVVRIFNLVVATCTHYS